MSHLSKSGSDALDYFLYSSLFITKTGNVAAAIALKTGCSLDQAQSLLSELNALRKRLLAPAG